VGPDGTAYINFMYKWANQCIAAFGPDGKPVAGKYLKGKVGKGSYEAEGKKNPGYPQDLESAVIGPVPLASGGIRVDLRGNIYVHGAGSVVKFPLAGGFITGKVLEGNFDPTPGVKGVELMGGNLAEGATGIYPGTGPFSSAGFGNNSCCSCRVPRFDVDRYGRVIMPDGLANVVRFVDNAGNRVADIGAYGNYDSQYVPADSKGDQPLVAVPEIPLAWPTGAVISEKHAYVCDTYNRRVVRADFTWKCEEVCDLK
jgi:hypothetical protein